MKGRAANITRRELVSWGGWVALGTVLAGMSRHVSAADLAFLDVAYAGSMGSMMEGPLRSAVSQNLRLEMRGRAQGSSALANLIVGGSIQPDVFIAVTPGPMLTVLRAGKAGSAEPIAHTEMVIAYSPKSQFAPQFEAASRGSAKWWEILQEPGLRFGRTDPIADPQGRNIIFTMMLAAKMYRQPDLVQRALGSIINDRQIFSEPTVLARLQSGELDASAAYKIQPGPFHLPYISLPKEINLSAPDVRAKNTDIELTVGGNTYYPEPLIYYAAALTQAHNSKAAADFVNWLRALDAQAIFRRYDYDPPDGLSLLRI
jgi:molybdate/tungstate transport system substrate-binding protein